MGFDLDLQWRSSMRERLIWLQVWLYAVYWLFSQCKYETEIKGLDIQVGTSFYYVTLTLGQGCHVGYLLIFLEGHYECVSGWHSRKSSMFNCSINFCLPWPWKILKVIQNVFIRKANIHFLIDQNRAIVLLIVSAKLSFFVYGQEHLSVTGAVIGGYSNPKTQNQTLSWPSTVTH